MKESDIIFFFMNTKSFCDSGIICILKHLPQTNVPVSNFIGNYVTRHLVNFEGGWTPFLIDDLFWGESYGERRLLPQSWPYVRLLVTVLFAIGTLVYNFSFISLSFIVIMRSFNCFSVIIYCFEKLWTIFAWIYPFLWRIHLSGYILFFLNPYKFLYLRVLLELKVKTPRRNEKQTNLVMNYVKWGSRMLDFLDTGTRDIYLL